MLFGSFFIEDEAVLNFHKLYFFLFDSRISTLFLGIFQRIAELYHIIDSINLHFLYTSNT